MKIFIVTSRYGVLLDDPQIFSNKEAAENVIISGVYNQVLHEVYDEIEDAGIDTDDIDAVLEWAKDNDYCTSYNCDCIDTCTIGDDWLEYKLKEIDLDKDLKSE